MIQIGAAVRYTSPLGLIWAKVLHKCGDNGLIIEVMGAQHIIPENRVVEYRNPGETMPLSGLKV